MKLLDSGGAEILLGAALHHGGEGTIHQHPHLPGHLIKIYKEPSVVKASKLESLVQIGQTAGDKFHQVAIWPTDLVYLRNGTSQPVGFVMRQVDGVAIHSIYGPKERKNRFASLTWKQLALIARNTAAAFHQLHATEAVLGDVNEGNFLVDPNTGLVSLIDCDSYQITHEGRQFLCPVGVGIWTPPELHGVDFKLVPRTTNHDNFGLAVLLFQLLFIGRHPFASPHQGDLEEAIRQRLFTYTECLSSVGITPPPFTLRQEDVGPEVFRLFDRAFLAGSDIGQVIIPCPSCGQKNRVPRKVQGPVHCARCTAAFPDGWRELRPTAEEWFNALSELESTLTACSTNPLHSHLPDRACPFCALDQEGYAAFAFSGFAHKGGLSMEDIVRLFSEIEAIKIPIYSGSQDLVPAPTRVSFPAMIRLNPLFLLGWIMLPAAAALIWWFPGWSAWIMATLAVGLIATGSKSSDFKKQLKAAERDLLFAQTEINEAERHLLDFLGERRDQLSRIRQRATPAYRTLLELPAKEKNAMLELEEQRRPQQFRAHLEKYPLPRYIFDSFKPGVDQVFRANGIKTAFDIQGQARPPGTPGDLWKQLRDWSQGKAEEFVFDYQSPVSTTGLLALKNRMQRERTDEQVCLNDCYQNAKAIAAEAKQYYETRLGQIVRSAQIAREAESRIEALRS